MKKIKVQPITSVIVIFLLGASLILIAAQDIEKKESNSTKGIVTYADGRVKKKPVQAEDWESAEKNTPVNTGDRVRTYQRSRAELELLQLDIIRMAPETTIDIVKLYEETKGKVKETKLSLEQGDIWAKLEKKGEAVKFDISTPVAGAAITGTVFRMCVNVDSSTELKVYTGEVKITNAPEKVGLTPQYIGKPHQVPGPHEVPGPREVSMDEWVYIVKNMQKISISRNGSVKFVGSFKGSDPDEQTNWVKWNLERDKK